MRVHRLFLLAVVIFITGELSHVAQAQPVKVLPVADFFKKSSLTGVQFSPNGKYVMCLVPYERRQNLAVIDLERGTKKLLTSFKDKDVQQHRWASNERILFLVDEGGKEEFSLYAVNRDGSDPSDLQPQRPLNSFLRRLDGDAKTMLVQAAMTNLDSAEVSHLNLKTGKLSPPIARAPGLVSGYLLDSKNVVRIAVTKEDDQVKVLHRKANNTEWTEISTKSTDGPGWSPLAIDSDDRTLFVTLQSGPRQLKSIYRFDLETLKMGELVLGDDTYDVDGVVTDGNHKVVGLGYDGDRQRFLWLDPDIKRIHASMSAALPDTIHVPTQISEDGSRILFRSYSDRDPGVYYLYDKPTGKVSEIAVVKPEINLEQMAPVKAISYQARDGMTLYAYLTLPVGRDPKNLPLIIHPHGGPYGIRDSWTFNPEVQFYANRGFAVLQINYRGSGGYGFAYEKAGFMKWGLEMQDDLSDGVAWAVKQGLADPKRVVISGASYGGYATMAGLTYTPELYVAGINYVGVVNIIDLMPKTGTGQRVDWYRTRFGNLSDSKDKKRLYDTSPVHFADRIQAPLLMAYGRNDPRVKVSHAYDIESALKKNKKTYELIINDDEGHGFRNEERSIEFYSRVDAFLKKYVPGQRTN